jgi:hypothetical protein
MTAIGIPANAKQLAALVKESEGPMHSHSPPDFEPIILISADEGQLQVIAEVLEVLGAQA